MHPIDARDPAVGHESYLRGYRDGRLGVDLRADCDTVAMTARARLGGLTRHGALRVPEITVLFWIIKSLSTAMGESTSDFSVHAMNPVLAVVLGFCGFA